MLAGILFALIAMTMWGVGAIFVRLGLRGMRASTGTFISLLVGVPFSLAVALVMDWRALAEVPFSVLPWLVLVGLLNFQLGRFLNYSAISAAGVSRAAPIIGIAPLFASLIAVVFLGETLSVYLLLGTVSIVGGLGLILSSQ
ncbi:MAG: DMT family transporter [Chloroflexi bacterium]|nr:DMT family transporter [Chloroflexota bacterium]